MGKIIKGRQIRTYYATVVDSLYHPTTSHTCYNRPSSEDATSFGDQGPVEQLYISWNPLSYVAHLILSLPEL